MRLRTAAAAPIVVLCPRLPGCTLGSVWTSPSARCCRRDGASNGRTWSLSYGKPCSCVKCYTVRCGGI